MFFLPRLLQIPLSIREGGINIMFRTESSVIGTYSQSRWGNHETAFTTTHRKENSLQLGITAAFVCRCKYRYLGDNLALYQLS